MAGDWFEELIFELYELKGYFCLRNIPGESKRAGGRDEIDIIAISFHDNKINEVIWVEVTVYLSGGRNTIKSKFSSEKERYIRKYLEKIYNIDLGSTKIEKRFYIATRHPKIEKDKKLPAKLIMNKEIVEECGMAIKDYKSKYHEIAASKSGKEILTLPETAKQIKLTDWILKFRESKSGR